MRSVLVLALAGVASAQGPLEQLASPEPRVQAWGAFLAGEQGLAKAAPALERALASDQYAVRSAALDALIRLDAKLDWQTLEPVYRRHPTEALILLALHPRFNRDGLLALVKDEAPLTHWYVACNLLANAGDEALASRLLDGLELRLEITVSDDGRVRAGGRSRGIGCGCGVVRVADGWPPRVVYSLTTRQAAASRPLAPGLNPVYFRRRVIQTKGGVGSSSSTRRDRNRDRLLYLAQLLGTLRLPLQASRSKTLVWRDAATYLREVAAERARYEADFEKVTARLVARGRLDRRPAPEITVHVNDLRKNAAPLPRFP